jgi:hypothetical protein
MKNFRRSGSISAPSDLTFLKVRLVGIALCCVSQLLSLTQTAIKSKSSEGLPLTCINQEGIGKSDLPSRDIV